MFIRQDQMLSALVLAVYIQFPSIFLFGLLAICPHEDTITFVLMYFQTPSNIGTFSEDFQIVQRCLEDCMPFLVFFLWSIRWTEGIVNSLILCKT
jgi:hypothetical protein